jgi:hypothetical protein
MASGSGLVGERSARASWSRACTLEAAMHTITPESPTHVRPSDLAIELDELELIATASPDRLSAARMRLVLVRALGALGVALASHFGFEEQGGYMHDLLTANPDRLGEVTALQGQHAALTQRLLELLGRSKHADPALLQGLLLELVVDVRAHEQAERELLAGAFDDEVH